MPVERRGMKIRTSSDWRDALPYDTPVPAADAMPGDPAHCTDCGTAAGALPRTELWAVKHRHPNNPAGFVRLYCGTHRPLPKAPPAPVTTRRERAVAARRPAAPTVPERPSVLCPDCFVEVPATGVCGMCGQRVG